jgi:hypothetical protein
MLLELILIPYYSQIDQIIEELQKQVDEGTLDLRIPDNFVLTAPSHDYTHRMSPQEIAENSEFFSYSTL